MLSTERFAFNSRYRSGSASSPGASGASRLVSAGSEDGTGILMDANLYSMLTQAERRIDRAWYAALVAGCMSLIIVGFNAVAMEEFGSGDRSAVVDALLVLALAYGVLRRSRVAAALLLIHFILLRGVGLVLDYHRLTRSAGVRSVPGAAGPWPRRRRRSRAVLRR